MSDLRKAAQQALEALKKSHPYSNSNIDLDKHSESITALRAAIVQPEPFQPDWDRVKALEASLREHMAEIQRLKAQPEQDLQLVANFLNEYGLEVLDVIASLKAQPESEPESVLHKWAALFEDPNNDWQAGYEHARRWVLEVGLQSIATPPQRKPLTEEEIEVIRVKEEFDQWGIREGAFKYCARAIERAHGIGGEHE